MKMEIKMGADITHEFNQGNQTSNMPRRLTGLEKETRIHKQGKKFLQ